MDGFEEDDAVLVSREDSNKLKDECVPWNLGMDGYLPQMFQYKLIIKRDEGQS